MRTLIVWAEIAVVFGVFMAALLGTRVILRHAIRRGMVDIPNARSSHVTPTPRGGGVAIVIASLAGWGLLSSLGRLDHGLLFALTGGGGAIALVGYIDDRWRLSPWLRLAVHIAASAWALYCLGGLPPLRFGGVLIDLGIAGHLLAGLAIVWALNLFNFMDGIDGLAASEAVFISVSIALLGALAGHGAIAVPLVFAAACAGFLYWNWTPARIFMGDVGSGYIGFCIAVLTIGLARTEPSAAWQTLILGGLFFADATVTLMRRLLRGESLHQAHRTHAYQWLARKWRSHGRVVRVAALVNLVWLWPCAWLIQSFPQAVIQLSLLALAPLFVLAALCGAGKREEQAP